MKKRVCFLLVLALLISVLSVPVVANENTPDSGILLAWDVKTFFGEYVISLSVLRSSGDIEICSLAKQCVVDGVEYDISVDDPFSFLNENQLISFSLNQNKEINKMEYMKEKSSYTNVSFNEQSGIFSYEEDAKKLPIYYYMDGEYCLPILSEDLLYSVDVYPEVAVVITSFTSKSKDVLISYVEKTEMMDAGLTEQILSFEVKRNASEGCLWVEIKDLNGNTVAQGKGNNNESFAQVKVPNQTAQYKAIFSILNESNERISDLVFVDITVTENEVLQGFLSIVEARTSFGIQTVHVLMESQDGTQKAYTFEKTGVINGVTYNASQGSYDHLLRENVYATFCLTKDGKICAMNFSDTFTFSPYEEIDESYIFWVEGYNLTEGDTLLFATYKNDALTGIDIRPYLGETEEFSAPLDTDRVAIMTWGSTKSMLPETEKEVIELK